LTLQNINLKKDYKNRDKLDFTRWNQDQQAIETAVNKFISSVTSGDSGADSLSMTPIEDISTDNKVQTFLKSLVTLLLSQVVADYGKLGLAKVLAKIDGTGGSNIVGSKSIIGVSGNTVFDQIKSLKALIDQIEEGVLPDDYIDNTKLANDVKVGSLAALATVDKSAVTAAINEVLGNVGDIENLETANKTSVVGAVNEVKGDIGDK
jgi:hypothetical protein